MFRKRGIDTVHCELFRTTSGTVVLNANRVAIERVRRDGLPLVQLGQVLQLQEGIIDRAMVEAGLPPSPCETCTTKSPVVCPRVLALDPGLIDYQALADAALEDFRVQFRETPDPTFP